MQLIKGGFFMNDIISIKHLVDLHGNNKLNQNFFHMKLIIEHQNKKIFILLILLCPFLFNYTIANSAEKEYIRTDEIVKNYSKFSKKYAFDKYPVANIYTGQKGKLKSKYFKSLPKNIRQNIKNQFREAIKPNFAGHFLIITWGCGSDCQENVIIDYKTGKAYETINSSRGLEYKLGSSIIIANLPYYKPTLKEYFYTSIGIVSIFHWENNKAREVYRSQ